MVRMRTPVCRPIRFDPATNLQAVHDRHRVIDDGDIRFQLRHQFESFPAVGRFSADNPVGARLDNRAKPGPHNFMIVRNQDLLHADFSSQSS